MLTVEKIGGTSMSDYLTVRDNVVLGPNGENPTTGRILVVSAYGGMTDQLLEHKKSGKAGVFAHFSSDEDAGSWREALNSVRQNMFQKNAELFNSADAISKANVFIGERLDTAERCLEDLQRLCGHGHFSLEAHLSTVREMLASLGEAHSARNMAELLKEEGVNARFVDLTGWNADKSLGMDEHILEQFKDVDLGNELPVVTGYAHCESGIMSTFDRGYSEMTFSRIAVLVQADEALIHKEYHLSSADPKVVGVDAAVPIGRTNYDVADQLANLGMEAIHPKAAKGLRQSNIPLRVKNTFEPDHNGTLITTDYVSEKPCVEIIAGKQAVYAVECFNQDMVGDLLNFEQKIMQICQRFRCTHVTKDVNANTVTHYLSSNMKKIKRVQRELEEMFPESEINVKKVSIVSAIGSDMQVPGILAKTVGALADAGISVLAVHQSMRQVDMQFIVEEVAYEAAVRALHKCLVEVHDHGIAICAA
ncbi:aspartate kinase [Saccharophagus degradans]|uniref:aspartate kinase n=2 Tax=Saccharophagus degradans TaxID=86304 RepID=A0AAW7X7R6_9GAMM|nr:aspartate kinase [Saccharophagus degradans]MBU2984335.1 aspartate kinase [Saccharophagus degradans]MDO6422902.1 aspartate kinase [Saccharophagus degradans]MDO6607047.1 aspartate kinase [Saccharophagus degradans]